jgi:hypothetical protein
MTEFIAIDDFSNPERAVNGNRWQYFSDRVMGGVSKGEARFEGVAGRAALHLTGTVSLENNGGFVQVALDLGPGGGVLDASDFDGIALTLLGDGRRYGVHLRSADIRRPWQSYRAAVDSTSDWTTHYLRFNAFRPHRIDLPLDTSRLRRIGLLAIGAAGPADVAICSLGFFRENFL